ncbi:MAG: M20/M25/M40 family metallo-hydrolase [Planctomycetaceae bacterium]
MICLLLLLPACRVSAQDQPSAAPLTDDQQRAIETITAGRVLSTVAFLSSDEMAGRQTPSAELEIASRFVASRFLGAGLEPLTDDGSYFQTTQLDMIQPPSQVQLKLADGSPVTVRGVLAGSNADLTISSVVRTEVEFLKGETAEAAASQTPAIVLIDEISLNPRTGNNPAQVLATVTRRIQPLVEKHAALVLMKSSIAGPLREIAEQLQERPLALRSNGHPGCAVVLIADDADFDETPITAHVPAAIQTSAAVHNVLAVLRGGDPELNREAVLVSAHLDHIGVTPSGRDHINNGADDNATGVTAVLSLADAFAALQQRPRRSIVFATFWGEEKGLLGSKAFVDAPLWPLEKIHANINIEMVGRPETDAVNKAWMTGWKHSGLGPVMNAGAQRAGVEIFNRTDVGEMLYTRSDNASFANRGVIAHSFSAGSLHSDYHQPTDEWQKLNIAHMTKVIQGLFAGILLVAETGRDRLQDSPETRSDQR